MTLDEIMKFLEVHGSEQTKEIFRRHGAKDPFFGVKVADLKTIQKKVKRNYELSMKLYRTTNSDAMYLAGLIADPKRMSPADLNEWADAAYWYMISDYTVADTAAKSDHGFKLALEWINSDNEFKESAGWATLSAYISYKTPSDSDTEILSELLASAVEKLHKSKNRVRYTMNGFIIACGSYIKSFTDKALTIADSIGTVEVDMGGTSCKVPPARASIEKVISKGKQGVLRKQGY